MPSTIPIIGTANSTSIQSTSDASPNALMERDSNGDTHGKTLFGDTAVRSLGGFGTGLLAKTASSASNNTNGTLVYDCTSGPLTHSLAAAGGYNANTGFPILEIKRYDATPSAVTANFLTIGANASELIDGDLDIFLTLHGESVRIQTDGIGWKILSRFIPQITVAKAALFSAGAEGNVYLCTMGSAYTITLPPAANWKGKILTFIKVDAAAFGAVLDGDGAELINGASTKACSSTQWTTTRILSDGTSWYTV